MKHAAPRRRGRAARWALALLVVLAPALGGLGLVSPAHGETTSNSALTVSGKGEYSSLRVTVSQTQHLIDQVVKVSWKGAAATQPEQGGFAIDYLQIMECWGDSSNGPDREQCQFGASKYGGGGLHVNRRQVNGGQVDPAETYTTHSADCGADPNIYVPFRSVTGVTERCKTSAFFDASTTNEISLARTQSDGTGTAFFETQTATEAPGLGCGAPVASAGGTVAGRGCWLVVVPRNNREVDGSLRTDQQTNQLDSTPLSATNWSHHISIPLDFEPIGASCKLGAAETPTVGHELLTEAMSRWQSALCGGGDVYGFAQVPVDAARRQVTSAQPGVAFMSLPLGSNEQPSSGSLTYAPTALSGVAIAFNVDRQYQPDAPASDLGREGSRFDQLNLTPRLVAKLLTQSYRSGVDYAATYLKDNPDDLTHDPEFLKYNPEYGDHLAVTVSIGDATTTLGQSDVATTLWNWIKQDKSARDFVDGNADPWGMKVNPHYKSLSLPIDSFPKADLFCRTFPNSPQKIAPLCTFDAHPYAADMHSAALAASQGDNLARTIYAADAVPPSWKAAGGAPNGQQQVLALTDTATASRYNLPTARLMNPAGKFVAPSDGSMLAGLSDMKADPSVKGVLDPNPGSTNASAYPLTMLTYAVTNPAALTAPLRTSYARLLNYVAGAGQTPGETVGTLPDGYVPLTSALRAQTRSVASELRDYKGPTVDGSSGNGDGSPSGSGSGSGGTGTSASPGGGPGAAAAGGAGAGGAAANSQSTAGATGGANPTGAAGATVASGRTEGVAAGLARFAVLAALLLGLATAGGGGALLVAERSRGLHS